MKIKSCFAICLLISLSLLSACGFHLSDSTDIPKQLKTMYLTAGKPYTSFMRQLRTSLVDHGITLVDDQNSAKYTINITANDLTYTESGLSTNESTRNYSVNSNVSYVITDKAGKAIVPSTSFSTSQTITLFANQLLTNTNELQTAQTELERQNIEKFYDHLESINTRKLLNHPNSLTRGSHESSPKSAKSRTQSA
jgi:LPS-assembly lipoprotein